MLNRLPLLLIVLALIVGCSKKSKEELVAEGLKLVKEGNANGAIVLFKNAIEMDQNYIDGRYQLAKAYVATKKYEQAEKEFQKVLRQDPSRKEIKLEIARVFNFMGKPEDAISEAGNYQKSYGDSSEAAEIIGTAYRNKKDPGNAEKFYLKAISLDQTRVAPKIELAGLYVQGKKEKEARVLIEEILAKEPSNVKAYYMLATLENSIGKSDRALEIFQKIQSINPSDAKASFNIGMILINKGNLEQAEKISEELLKKFPKKPEGYHLKGLVHYQKRDWNEAIASLQNAVKLQETLMAYYHLGLSLYNKGEYELALSQFRKIMDYYPSFNPARLMTAVIFLKQKRVDDSIAELKKLIQKDENNALAYNILGSAYVAKGAPNEAMGAFDRATKIDPKLVDAHLKKGLYSLDRGNDRLAEVELQTAVNIAPDVVNSRFILSSYYINRKNYPKALSVLKEGLRGQKGDAVLYNSMATVEFAAKRDAEAVKFLQKAKELDPALAAPANSLALYYASKGEMDKALEEYRGILKHTPQDVTALVNSGRICEAKGKGDEALQYYQKARETKQMAGYAALAGYYAAKKDMPKAVSIIDDALKEDARNASMMEMKGKLLLADKRYDEAVKVSEGLEQVAPDTAAVLKVAAYTANKDFRSAADSAQRMIRQKPDSAYGYVLLASVYERQSDFPRAVETLKKAAQMEPKNVQVKMLLGNLFAAKKDYTSAIATFQSVEKLNPKHFSAIFAQGLAYDQLGKKSEAVKKYKQTIALSPTYAPALNNLAYILADTNAKNDALRFAEAAYKANPNNPGVMDTMGYVLLKCGKKEQSRTMLEKAVKLMPQNPSVYYHLALVYREFRDREQTLKFLRKSLDFGEFAESAAARTLLAEMKSR